MIRARFRRLAGLALAALLAATLAPSIAHALQTSALAVAGVGLCGTPGGGSTTPSGPPADRLGAHCPLCTLVGDPPLPVVDSTFTRTAPCLRTQGPADAEPLAQARAWPSAPARAPPASTV